jgi:hypothetical protein
MPPLEEGSAYRFYEVGCSVYRSTQFPFIFFALAAHIEMIFCKHIYVLKEYLGQVLF